LRLRRSTAREQRQPNSRRGQNPQNLAHSQRSDALYATHPKETKPDGLPEGHGSGSARRRLAIPRWWYRGRARLQCYAGIGHGGRSNAVALASAGVRGPS
jgi:hypothetical protein